MNPKHLSHFFNGQHASLAETIIERRKLIAPSYARHDARGERLSFARMQTLAVQQGGNLRISVVAQQPVDGGNHFGAGLPLLPRSLR